MKKKDFTLIALVSPMLTSCNLSDKEQLICFYLIPILCIVAFIEIINIWDHHHKDDKNK